MNRRKLLRKYINIALDLLYRRDAHLINNCPVDMVKTEQNHHVGERAIVFRFAHYLQNLIDDDPAFKGYHLDCEYNRNGRENKALPSFPNGTFPDLIIHRRGDNEHNLLIMEFKTYWNSDTERDIVKIKEFRDSNGRYKYKYGVSVVIGLDAPTLTWL
ncbi:MAG: hypothetical protein IJZ85_08890 [Lachnospiraceae bacterium]|nr:hypothetical protein [Lachnospiraceae bacterium]